MQSKKRINEKLLLVAALCTPVYFTALQLVEKYQVDVGNLGQAIVELVTIPALMMPLFIFLYTLISAITERKMSVWLLLTMLCSAAGSAIIINSLLLW